MEYLNGETLAERLDRSDGVLPLPAVSAMKGSAALITPAAPTPKRARNPTEDPIVLPSGPPARLQPEAAAAPAPLPATTEPEHLRRGRKRWPVTVHASQVKSAEPPDKAQVHEQVPLED